MREREKERDDVRVSESESDNQWVKVRSRNERRHERVRPDPRQCYAGNMPEKQQLHHAKANWRERSDISTFYFTRFSESVTERDLWAHFKRWGDVREIFISKTKKQNGEEIRICEVQGGL